VVVDRRRYIVLHTDQVDHAGGWDLLLLKTKFCFLLYSQSSKTQAGRPPPRQASPQTKVPHGKKVTTRVQVGWWDLVRWVLLEARDQPLRGDWTSLKIKAYYWATHATAVGYEVAQYHSICLSEAESSIKSHQHTKSWPGLGWNIQMVQGCWLTGVPQSNLPPETREGGRMGLRRLRSALVEWAAFKTGVTEPITKLSQ
jgi:hypothetical protein